MARTKQYHIGIDVGGTKIAAALLHQDKLIEHTILATPQDSLEHFLIMLKASLDPLTQIIKDNNGHLTHIGLGVPGVIDYEKVEISIAANLPILNKVKLPEELKKILNLPDTPMYLDNDVNCFVRAEALLGAGKKSNNVYGMTIGTGIGSGWYVNGEIYNGHHGGANEVGHMIVDFDHLITLEQAYHQLTQHNPALLAEEAYRGDILAEKTFAELGAYLGIALSTVVNLLDPEIIILGGRVLDSGNLFLDAAKDNLKKYTFSPNARSVRLVKGKLGPLAAAIGAGLLSSKK